MAEGETNWRAGHTAGVVLTVFAIVLVAMAPTGELVAWLLFLLLMATLTVIASRGITGSSWGVLIDERNRLSLPRLQMVVWMLPILSAYLAAAIGNVRAGAGDPLTIAIPQAVWILIGINTTALVGTPLLLGTKQGGAAALPHSALSDGGAAPAGGASMASANPRWRELPAASAHQLRMQGDDPSKMAVDGSVVLREAPSGARWSDLFQGDEASDVATLDLSKVQLFFFTIVLVLSYAVALGALFAAADAARLAGGSLVEGRPDPRLIAQFPPLDIGIVTILGISNAGFLANKAVPRAG